MVVEMKLSSQLPRSADGFYVKSSAFFAGMEGCSNGSAQYGSSGV